MTTEDRGPRDAQGGSLAGPRVLSVVLLLLAAALIVSAFGITRGGGYSVIGPATIPLVVAFGLLVLSAIFAVRTTIRPDQDLAERAAEEEFACHWPTVGLIALALFGYALALDGFDLGPIEVPSLGYIPATGMFLPITARILGSRALVRDVIVGFGIAIVIYFGFTEFLGVRLPGGLLDLVL
jgi:putative tricarboxylic transport membrane protein